MASDVVYEAIEAYLRANWTETPLQFENENFDIPSSREWVMVEMAGTVYGQQTIGADNQADNRWDEEGLLWLHVLVQAGSGSQLARRRCKALADLFRGALLLDDSLEFMDADIGIGAQGDDEGSTYRLSVSVDWRRMEP